MIFTAKPHMICSGFMVLQNPNKMEAAVDLLEPPKPARFIAPKSVLENYFCSFRGNIIGHQQTFESPFGEKELIYADWTASGRAYLPIEKYIQKEIMPFVGNTHTDTTVTGTLMSKAYEQAKVIVKQHVHANSDD